MKTMVKRNPLNPSVMVKTIEAFAGPIDGKQPEQDQPLTFDDFRSWIKMTWKDGRRYMITEMGDMIHEEEGRHMEVFALDKKQPQRLVLHETWVNAWLRERDTVVFDAKALK